MKYTRSITVAIYDYYCYLDDEIGQILKLVDNETTVFIVSDHGAKKMDGGICVNEWLMREGYLTLKTRPTALTPIDRCEIDWSRTKVWGDGGYYARIFLNVEGREPRGIVKPGEVEALRDELKARFEAIVDPQGVNIGTKVFKATGDLPGVQRRTARFDCVLWRPVLAFGW